MSHAEDRPCNDPLNNRERFARDRKRDGMTDGEAGKLAGVSRQAMAMRRLRARRRLGSYVAAIAGVGEHRKRIRVRPIPLSFVEGLA